MGYRRPFRLGGVAAANNAKKFGVWTGSSIGTQYNDTGQIAEAIRRLLPDGEWQPEWIVKAGEGGSYQARNLHSTWGDPSQLAIASADDFADRVAEGAANGISVIPYVVVRGRPEWLSAELAQLAELASLSERVVINLEPGAEYWNGPTSPNWLRSNYLEPLRKQSPAGAKFELAAIPRDWVFRALGGVATIEQWLEYCEYASWECYDASATDLRVDDAFTRLSHWLGVQYNAGQYRIPIVQRSRIGYWANTEFAANGLEVWNLDSD